jgi:hypothetical protein
VQTRIDGLGRSSRHRECLCLKGLENRLTRSIFKQRCNRDTTRDCETYHDEKKFGAKKHAATLLLVVALGTAQIGHFSSWIPSEEL